MKILWITHDVLDVFISHVVGKPTRGGSWIAPLFYGISNTNLVQLAILSPVINGKQQKVIIDDITYFSIPIKNGDNTKPLYAELINHYLWVVNTFKPDIIHIHGTENNFGLIRKHIPKSVPIVCSIQGIISAYTPFLSASVVNDKLEKYNSVKNWLGKGGIKGFKKRWMKYKELENEIFKSNSFFIGRTLWDKAQLYNLNKDALYFHGEEMLRTPFESLSWDINICNRYSIFMPSAAYSIKGLHVLLKAINILKDEFPLIKLQVPLFNSKNNSTYYNFLFGEDYRNYINSLIKNLGLEKNIVFHGRLSASEMAEKMHKSHVFVLPSFIDNSPNSLGEAMSIGLPTITSSVGGIFSIVKDGESSLLFPSGDYCYLAEQIKSIFSDDCLTNKISLNGKKVARVRHDKEIIPRQYIEIYKNLILSSHNI